MSDIFAERARRMEETGHRPWVEAFEGVHHLGRTVQSRRLRLEALERGHDEAAARAVADERLRIAQEVHDVAAHSLGVIAVQAGVGAHVIERDPTEARRALYGGTLDTGRGPGGGFPVTARLPCGRDRVG